MSSAFVRESDEQWLHDLPPTVVALKVYLTWENNGIRIYEKNTRKDIKTGKIVHMMSNGLGYAVGDDNKWFIV